MNEVLFYVADKTIRIYLYKVDYKNSDMNDDNPKLFRSHNAASRFAERVNGTVTPLDTTDYEWMDGIVIEGPTTNPMIQALEIYHMGREAWEAKQNTPSAEDRMAQMEADIAYLAMLTDTDMEV